MENVRIIHNKSHGRGHILCLIFKRRYTLARSARYIPKILSREIYTYIANNTSLSKAQVKECFMAYGDMMLGLIESNYTPEDLTVLLPKIGTFYFHKRQGRKNGSTYKFYGKEVVANNEMSYYRLKFKTCHQLNARIKEKTKHYEE